MKNKPHTYARLRVDAEMIIKALGLPPGTDIYGARVCFTTPGVLEFAIEHPTLAPIPMNETIPSVVAVYEDGRFSRFEKC